MKSVSLSREQLFRLVWQKPISKLTEEFAYSDVGLAKLCTRHDIPTPPRGYWAKQDAGKAPATPDLPTSPVAQTIVLCLRESNDDTDSKELDAAIEREKLPEMQIHVREQLRSLSDEVQQAHHALRDAKLDYRGLFLEPVNTLDIHVSRDALPRALRIADALCKAFQARGWDVSIQGDATFVHVGDVPIAWQITEKTLSVEVPPKPSETWRYEFHYNRKLETVSRPSGQLCVGIKEPSHLWEHRQQKKWSDTENKRLEDQLNLLIIGILKLVSAAKLDRKRREQEARKREEERQNLETLRRQQEAKKAAREREAEQVMHLRRQARRWRESQNMRAFIAEAQRRGAEEAWVEWATRQADRLDPFPSSLSTDGTTK